MKSVLFKEAVNCDSYQHWSWMKEIRVQSDGIKMTRENQMTRVESCTSCTLSTINPI